MFIQIAPHYSLSVHFLSVHIETVTRRSIGGRVPVLLKLDRCGGKPQVNQLSAGSFVGHAKGGASRGGPASRSPDDCRI
ncbi:hypothetical protein HZ326_28700 [Fusarium oxysporum f. sp. albedinis]|nr:hypothetical protein HZ326_29691 [Fusarium oxysporum f. sp. albedinis]KAJ0128204.1 hypothetical protein HZ326_28700 [Fusarium oxysporum f. sp. albedinis]